MSKIITAEQIRKSINLKHSNYKYSCDLSEKLHIHADGKIPTALINERRPSEPEEIKKYREKIYVPKTKNPISKVINSLEKIRRSQDWNIQYDAGSVPSSVARGESLELYCEVNYPVHTSLTNWAFSELLKQYLLDANGIVAVVPDAVPAANEYVKPKAVFFTSEQVLDYIENEYLALKSNDTSTYTSPQGRNTYQDGAVYYIITPEQVLRYEQISTSGELKLALEYPHNLGKLPAFKVGGIFLKRKNNDTIYESRIASMLPSLDEAAREYSDLQAEIVQHIHSEKYAYTNTECKHCKGSGKVSTEGKMSDCKVCGGHGSVLNVSPYGIHLIDAARVGEHQLPSPPIGYIQKTADIAKLQDERVRQHIYDALASLNMEFLAETPLNQSGTAKEVDKDELNNFVNSVAEDIVKILDNVYFFINEYRYSSIVPDKEKRMAMLPEVNVPVKYDILNSNHILADIAAATTANVSPVIRRALEIEFAKKKFNTDPNVSYEAQAVLELDPLYGLTEDAKMTRKSNGAITDIDYIISCNIVQFVRRAVESDRGFYKLPDEKKRELMRGFAEEVNKANLASYKKLEVPTENVEGN